MVELPSSLLKNFASVVNEKPVDKKPATKVFGTVVQNGNDFVVRLDGAEGEIPVGKSVAVRDGDRVLVQIRDHKAYISDNFTAPPDGRVRNMYFKHTEQGLIIGRIDEETGDPSGNYVLITNEDYQIRNEAGAILAKFGDDYVHLGFNSDGSVIYLCNTEGRIFYANDALVMSGEKATGIRSAMESGAYSQVAVASNSSQKAATIEVNSGDGHWSIFSVTPTGVNLAAEAFSFNGGAVVTANATFVEGYVQIAGRIKAGEGRRYYASLSNAIPSGYRLVGVRGVDTTHNQTLRLTAFGAYPDAKEVFAKLFNTSNNDYPKTGTDRSVVTIYWFAIRSAGKQGVNVEPIDLPDNYDPDD